MIVTVYAKNKHFFLFLPPIPPPNIISRKSREILKIMGEVRDKKRKKKKRKKLFIVCVRFVH